TEPRRERAEARRARRGVGRGSDRRRRARPDQRRHGVAGARRGRRPRHADLLRVGMGRARVRAADERVGAAALSRVMKVFVQPDPGGPTMTALDETTQLPDHPEFALVMRGYDRLQVDDYIERLTEWLAEAEHRQQRSEDDAKRLVAEVDARDRHIGELERERVASPGAVIEATAADVARLLEEASAERDRMLAAARDLVAGLEHAARADCAATVEQAGEIRAGAVQEADDIRARAEHA